jgi:hypothetical protein
MLTDGRRVKWSVKWGEEVKAETFASRMLWATGYLAEPTYFVSEGRIDSVGAITRASNFIDRTNGGYFRDARFELRDNLAFHPLPTDNWSLDNNPFLGSRELHGLKVMMMLLSNWDVKDARSSDGPNTAIAEVEENGTKLLFYGITDWGATMGRWGDITSRSKWDCKGYAAQTPDFVNGVDASGFVIFGFRGKRTDDVVRGIRVSDVQWLMRYLGRISDAQIAAALRASGATPEETACYGGAVRSRIEQLRKVSGPASAGGNGTLSKR